jgi:NADH-quinone oxidoreductase subunit M
MLLFAVLGPIALALLCVLLPWQRAARFLCLAGSAFTFGVGAVALADFALSPGADFRFEVSLPWSEALGAGLNLGVDGMSAAMLALSGLITLIATISGFSEQRKPRLYHALVLLLLAAMNGVFVTLDLLVFYVAWEAMLVPMLLLIGLWGGKQRRYAAIKFFVYTLAGSVMMLAMLLLLWTATPAEGHRVVVPAETVSAFSVDEGNTLYGLPLTREAGTDGRAATSVVVPRGFDLRHLALAWERWRDAVFLGVPLAGFGFLAVLLACLVKVPAVPLHTWLPHAHVEAPTAVSVLLAGVLLKLGVYGLYRVAVPLFPAEALSWAPLLGWVGVAGILWGALVALGQKDLKRLVAYSSVSHMGFCLLGLGSLTVAGLTAGMVQAVTHGLSSSLLFLLVGVVYDRAHHRDLDGFGGLAQPMPRFTWLLLIAALAAVGLPGLAGFPGEFLSLAGAFTADAPFPLLGALAALSVILTAAYLLSMVRKVAYGPLRHEAQAGFADCSARELFATVPLVLLIVALGVWPKPLVDALHPAMDALLRQVGGAAP